MGGKVKELLPRRKMHGSRHQHSFEENVRKIKKRSANIENKGLVVVARKYLNWKSLLKSRIMSHSLEQLEMELEVLIQKIKKAWNNFFPRPRGGGLHHNLIVSLDKLLW